MRTFLIASAGLALMASSGVQAQHVGTPGPAAMPRVNPGMGYRPGPMVRPGQMNHGPNRWGSKVGGRWWGGANAPGGWAAYRRPYRGWALPGYWNSPRFYISDWSGYGLVQPRPGYNWIRYYDDAVLVDGRGSVYDTADGIDWDGYGDAYDGGETQVYASPADRGYGTTYQTPRYERRSTSSGVGGAVVGAAVGGVAGNLIGGRGNRLGGTLIGAGVGAAAGYGVDRAANTRTVPVAPPPPPPPGAGYGASYGAPGYDRGYDQRAYDPRYDHGGYDVPVAPRHVPPPPRVRDWNGDGRTVVTTTAGGYGGNTYYYPGGSTTTIVVEPQPVITTTTTTTYEDVVTYSRPKVRTKRVYRGKLLRRAPTCNCR